MGKLFDTENTGPKKVRLRKISKTIDIFLKLSIMQKVLATEFLISIFIFYKIKCKCF